MSHLEKMVLSGIALSMLVGGGRLSLPKKWLPMS